MSGSAAGSNVLREFLVKLGYEEDQPSQRKMLDSISNMTRALFKMGAAIEAAAAGVVAGVAKIANTLESLYYLSDRTKAPIGALESFKYAFSQLGSSAEAAQSLLERFASWIRESPGHSQFVEQFTGKKYTDAVSGITNIGIKLQQLLAQGKTFSEIRTIAEQFGIGESDLLTLLRNTEKFRKEYTDMADKIVGDQDKMAEGGVRFSQRFRALTEAFSLFARRWGAELQDQLGGDLEELRQTLLRHVDEIIYVMKEAARYILLAGRALATFVVDAGVALSDLVKYFRSLPPETQELVKQIGYVVAAWVVLNTAFMKSPIGIIAALGIAMVELYADYKHWKDGAEHFIDWEKWEPTLLKAIESIKQIAGYINIAVKAMIGEDGWTKVMEAFLILMAGRWVFGIVAAFAKAGVAAGGFATKMAPLLAIMAAIDVWNKAQGPIELSDLPIGSPLWEGVPEEEQRHHANSPLSQKLQNPNGEQTSPWGHVKNGYNWLLGRKGEEQPVKPTVLDTKDKRVGEVMALLQELGHSGAAAAGITANLYAESRLNPQARNDSNHVGLAQWSTERQGRYAIYRAEKGLPPEDLRKSTWQDQIRFYDWELKRYEPQSANLLKNAKTAREGALGGLANERPEGWHGPAQPGPHLAPRADLADQIMRNNGSTAINPAPPAAAMQPQQAAPASAAPINQTNHVTVTGVSDPRKASELIMDSMARTNSDLVRNGKANAY